MPSPNPTADLHAGFSAPGARARPWKAGLDVIFGGRAERVPDDAPRRAFHIQAVAVDVEV